MRRRSMPRDLRITFNPTTFLYETEQDGITYGMPLELVRRLYSYYKIIKNTGQGHANLKMFYADLSKEEKAQIIRKGVNDNSEQDFTPDPEWED